MTALTDTAEERTLNWLTGNPTTAPVLPLRGRLMTANGTDSAAGTEVTGGTYAPINVAIGAAVPGSGASNTALLRWEGIPNPTAVAGLEIWDSAGSPVRWWRGPFGAPVTVTTGILEIPIGDLDLTLD